MSPASGIGHLRVVGGEADEPGGALVSAGCHTVTRPYEADDLRVRQMLESVLQSWHKHPSPGDLRRQLLRLLLEIADRH
ncbi:MAG: hypothetical protein ABJA82_02755 [Myxococcales bacterium]